MTQQNISAKPRLSVSTWSLHRTLGDPVIYGPGEQIPLDTHGRGEVSLLQLPGRLASFGIKTLEICHFHLPSLERGYLQEMRSELESAGVELFNLLVDAGDITHPISGERDADWISQWIDVASLLGAQRTRVIAGKARPTEETMALSIRRLRVLARQAEEQGVRLMTENWFALLPDAQHVLSLLDALEGHVGLCLDFGNWRGPEKYDEFVQIAPRAESCHTKATFNGPNVLDREDYVRCLEITRQAGFHGPYTLIYDGPDDNEWQGLALEREVVLPYLA